MNGPSRFEVTPEQLERNARGLAACREALAPGLARRVQPEQDVPLTPSEEIRQRALERAAAERRERRLAPPEPIATVIDRLARQRPAIGERNPQ